MLLRCFFISLLIFTKCYCFTENNTTDDAHSAEEHRIITARHCVQPRVYNFFQNSTFWGGKEFFFNPDIFEPLIDTYPKLPTYTSPSQEIVKTIADEILSQERITNDLVKLSNFILSTYNLKKPLLNLSFQPRTLDRGILNEAIKTFIRIICTPDPDREQGDRWRIQAFTRSFCQIWKALNGTKEDIILNQKLRAEIAFAIGFHPSLDSEKVLSFLFPHLAEYLKEAPNTSQKPIHTVFVLSLMHALTYKLYQPQSTYFSNLPSIILPHEKIQVPNKPDSSYKNSNTTVMCSTSKSRFLEFPNRLEEAKRREFGKVYNRGRRDSLEIDAKGRIINPNSRKKNYQIAEDDSDSDDSDNSDSDDEGAFILKGNVNLGILPSSIAAMDDDDDGAL